MSKQFLSGPVVLILEDEAIIALNLQDELQDAGYGIGGPIATCADALSWLHTNTPDVAILDTVLKDATCGEVARELASRTVPFLIYSGHREDRELLSEFHHVRWIEKPVPSSVLIEECTQLLAATQLTARAWKLPAKVEL
jgi:DNA-binding response OmpR family regulator